jgi:hypothetical protein
MYTPWKIFGEKARRSQIRHVMTPSVSFSGQPDFGDQSYGFYRDIIYSQGGQLDTVRYSPFQYGMFGAPSSGKSASMNFSLDNNLEMKIPIAGTDSMRKISLIDQFRISTSYNFLAEQFKLSNPSVSLRLKLLKNYTFSVNGVMDIYTYDENGTRQDVYRWQEKGSKKKGFNRIARFMGTSQTISYSFNNESLKKLFGKKEDTDSEATGADAPMSDSDIEAADAAAVTPPGEEKPRTSLRGKKEADSSYDADGYYLTNIPWNLNINYSFGFSYGDFDKEKRDFKYKTTQTLGLSGSISPTKAWSFNFNTSYDFDRKKFATMQCSVSRTMHCWSMSASIIPVGPYKSYNFTIAVNSSMLQDLKYTRSSNYRDAMNWGTNE